MQTLKTYKELTDYVSAFGKKQLNLLIICSRGGLGKTFMTEEALIEHAPLIFTGHATPLGIYKELQERNVEDKEFITIFDDVDALLANKTNVALLKQVCDTREEKIIKYTSSSPLMKDTPSSFETSCKVLMLVNDIKTEDRNLNALLTRGHLINFNPPDTEILRHISTFAEDKPIINFIKKYAPFSKSLNLRIYKRAYELKASGLDWQKTVLTELNIDERLYAIEQLLKKYKTDKEREKGFEPLGSRANYYRYKKLFLSKTAK